MSLVRALAAGGLSLVLPGAGHVVIRDWVRAILFAALYFVSFFLLVPIDQIVAAEGFTAMLDIAAEETDMMAQFTLSFITVFAAVDAGFRAFTRSTPVTGDSGPTCPECGRELDEDLEFCRLVYDPPGAPNPGDLITSR
ncbi:MAG: zinc ribbon domain-containing protein [Natrialbaceae archaeon]|nr:zinc ribbon domain-containing protein [Natrialbaceae archaeon]